MAQDKNIADATRKLMDGLYTVLDFLHRTSHSVDEVMNTAVQGEEGNEDNEEDVGPPSLQELDNVGKYLICYTFRVSSLNQ